MPTKVENEKKPTPYGGGKRAYRTLVVGGWGAASGLSGQGSLSCRVRVAWVVGPGSSGL